MSIPFFEKKFACATDPSLMFGQCPKFGSFFMASRSGIVVLTLYLICPNGIMLAKQ